MPKTTLQSVIFTAITAWFMVYIMTLPVQLFIAGPIARLIFRSIFIKDRKKNEQLTTGKIQEEYKDTVKSAK